jgi:hypothetical protein
LRGLTGAVGLTDGSGIGLSVSGNTLTFSNTGVLSFNGLTGAVTGVTTGIANTFGPLQSFTNGISAAGGTFSALTRFNAGISAAGATFTGPVNLTNTLLINGTQGSNNQVLTSTGSGITWATPAGGGGGVDEAFVIAMATVL